MYLCTFKQNITQCKFGGNTGGSGNDIYFGGSSYPADRIINSCSSSDQIRFFSASADYSAYLPQCVLYAKAYVAASGLLFVSIYE
jgi:hypothetical protein